MHSNSRAIDGGRKPKPEPQKHQTVQEGAENGLNEVLKWFHYGQLCDYLRGCCKSYGAAVGTVLPRVINGIWCYANDRLKSRISTRDKESGRYAGSNLQRAKRFLTVSTHHVNRR